MELAATSIEMPNLSGTKATALDRFPVYVQQCNVIIIMYLVVDYVRHFYPY